MNNSILVPPGVKPPFALSPHISESPTRRAEDLVSPVEDILYTLPFSEPQLAAILRHPGETGQKSYTPSFQR